MKKIIALLAATMIICMESRAQTYTYPNNDVLISGQQVSVKMRTQNWQGTNGYIYLPRGYDSTQSKRYALIDFYHGAGGNGDPSNALNDQGLLHMINNGMVPYSSTTPGDTMWFIVYSVAGDYMGTSGSYAQMQTDYRFLLDYYRLKIDTTRIYATGLSAGGNQTLVALAEDSAIFAAGVPMSTVWSNMPSGDLNTLNTVAPGWIWQLHGSSDNTAIFSLAQSAIQNYNTNRPDHKALLATYSGAHCCWETYYNPTWKWTSNNSNDIGTYNNMSIYDWMLTHVKGVSAPVNNPPAANAGNNQTLTAGTTSATLTGSATQGTGTITSYSWTQTSGTTVTITSPTNAITNITGLQDGQSYTFRLTVTDSNNLTSTSDVSITVQQAVQPPQDTVKVLLYIIGGKVVMVNK